jgi:hypothetical protein
MTRISKYYSWLDLRDNTLCAYLRATPAEHNKPHLITVNEQAISAAPPQAAHYAHKATYQRHPVSSTNLAMLTALRNIPRRGANATNAKEVKKLQKRLKNNVVFISYDEEGLE